MPPGPSPTHGPGRGAWRGLRRRVATLAGALLLALGTAQVLTGDGFGAAAQAVRTAGALAGGLSSLAERLQR